MAVSTPLVRRGMYCGSLDVPTQDLILKTREMNVVESLKHFIYCFSSEQVLAATDAGMSTRDYLTSNGEDLKQYIGTLRDYQTVGTAFMYFSPRSIIGDGVGLGKTVEISALLNMLHSKGEMKRFLMAVENGAIGQTWMELMRFTGLRIILLPSTKDKLMKVVNETDWTKVDGIIITHSTLSSSTFSQWLSYNLYPDGQRCKIFDTFILDESSVIKNQNTNMYRYTSNMCRLAKRVHFMNATVFENNIMDIYYQMDMLDSELLPSKSAIDKKFSVYKRTGYYYKKNSSGVAERKMKFDRVGYKNQEIFKESLKLVYFARTIEDKAIREELGKKEDNNKYYVYEVEPTIAQTIAINDGYRYNEVLNSPANVDPEAGLEFTREENPKLDKLCEIVENDLAGKLVMIYCFHIAAQEKIAEELIKIGRKPVLLNGTGSSTNKVEQRMEIIDGFNKGVYDVIITNIMKSLNLYNGDACILYSIVGNPSKQTQILGRIDRNVDNKEKSYYLLLYAHTDEEKLYKEVASQREQASRSLTIDARGAVSKFMEVVEAGEVNSDS